jgi:hypothetical protein
MRGIARAAALLNLVATYCAAYGVTVLSPETEQKAGLQSLHGWGIVVGDDFVVTSAPRGNVGYECKDYPFQGWTDEETGETVPSWKETFCSFKQENQGLIYTHDRRNPGLTLNSTVQGSDEEGWGVRQQTHEIPPDPKANADGNSNPPMEPMRQPHMGYGIALDGDLLAATAPGLGE